MAVEFRVNHLANETSPYLRQHATNPVDWYPWDKESLAKARSERKPILLSIGYSACHWCHVMANESFVDPSTAELMNKLFINIKVDREERPDLDKVYQMAFQLLHRHGGGWPLTAFLHPDSHMPFYIGTYFPSQPRYEMPTFKQVLRYVADIFYNHHDKILQSEQALAMAFFQLAPGLQTDIRLNSTPLQQVSKALLQDFDSSHGGFGDAPKFPYPTNLERLLRNLVNDDKLNDRVSATMLTKSLNEMAAGGIYDQLGGGFFRYSVDSKWMIPHFEKMLYDNAQLLYVYACTYGITHEPLYAKIASETAAWVMREMQAKDGGYYATLDAHSEGQEGKFYLWDKGEVKESLTTAEYQVMEHYFGLNLPANFAGLWHLYVVPDKMLNSDFKLMPKEYQTLLASGREKLFLAREKRVYPARDEKVLTSWNSLMIKAMATAGALLNKPDLLYSAESALAFIKKNLWHDNRLFASYKDGQTKFLAYLDDYAFLLDALLLLLQIRWCSEDFDLALQLADTLLEDFNDFKDGGFFFTSKYHEKLCYRPKIFIDEALPSGNGVAAYSLLRLGHLKGKSRYLDAATKILLLSWRQLVRFPQAHNTLLIALEEYLDPPQFIITHNKDLVVSCNYTYNPRQLMFNIPNNKIFQDHE